MGEEVQVVVEVLLPWQGHHRIPSLAVAAVVVGAERSHCYCRCLKEMPQLQQSLQMWPMMSCDLYDMCMSIVLRLENEERKFVLWLLLNWVIKINDKEINELMKKPFGLFSESLDWWLGLMSRNASLFVSNKVARCTSRSAASHIKSEIGSLWSILSKCCKIERKGISRGVSAIWRRIASKTSNGLDKSMLLSKVGDNWDSSLSLCSSKTSIWTAKSEQSFFLYLQILQNKGLI